MPRVLDHSLQLEFLVPLEFVRLQKGRITMVESLSVKELDPGLVEKHHQNGVADEVTRRYLTLRDLKPIGLNLKIVFVEKHELDVTVPRYDEHWHCVLLMARGQTVPKVQVRHRLWLTNVGSFKLVKFLYRLHRRNDNLID